MKTDAMIRKLMLSRPDITVVMPDADGDFDEVMHLKEARMLKRNHAFGTFYVKADEAPKTLAPGDEWVTVVVVKNSEL